jgi:hypothetical protein
MPELTIECKDCKRDKTTDHHLIHVKIHMVKAYGTDNCIRGGCEFPIAHPDAYCEEHHFEWVHEENARHLALMLRQEVPTGKIPKGICSWNRDEEDCTTPRDRADSGYCKEHRRQYAREYHENQAHSQALSLS